MAKTDDLIDSLARGLQPVRPHALLRLLTKALLPGVLLSGAFILFLHGLRPDIISAMSLPAFWVKSFYPLALAINGICAVLIVARPGGLPKSAGLTSIGVYMLLAMLGLWQLHASPAMDYPKLIFGVSYWFCPLIIVASAAPVFFANIWFLRRCAPTRYRLAGFTAGMMAGAIGAWTYSWACIENGLPFVALWYSLGIVLCGLIGMALGPRLLRW